MGKINIVIKKSNGKSWKVEFRNFSIDWKMWSVDYRRYFKDYFKAEAFARSEFDRLRETLGKKDRLRLTFPKNVSQIYGYWKGDKT